MSDAWSIVLVVGVGTMAIKSSGPLLLGGRPLPGRVAAVVAMLAPPLLAALVAISAVGSTGGVTLDARVVGLAAAALALMLRAPVLLVVVVAAVAAALTRLLTGG
jgi:hypothetical protein